MKELVTAIELWDFKTLDRIADEILRTGGWEQLADTIRESMNHTARDAVSHLLGLDCTYGVDGSMLSLFHGIDASFLDELREKAAPVAMNLLEQQIEKGNTFFLDIERIAASGPPFVDLVSKIIEVRMKEISELRGKYSLSKILGTYYGFSIAVAGGIAKSETSEIMSVVNEIADSVGSQVRIGGTKIVVQEETFSNCTEETASLLASLARVVLTGHIKRLRKTIHSIANSKDSRALNILHRLLGIDSFSMKPQVVRALGEIGHPSSVEHLLEFYNQTTHEDTKRKTLRALGSIRSEESAELMILHLDDRRRRNLAIESLGKIQWTDSIDRLVEILDSLKMNKSSIKTATTIIAALSNMGTHGHDVLISMVSRIGEVVQASSDSCDIFRALSTVPGLGSHPVSDEFVALFKNAIQKTDDKRGFIHCIKEPTHNRRLQPPFEERIASIIVSSVDTQKEMFSILRSHPRLAASHAVLAWVINQADNTEDIADFLAKVPKSKEILFDPRFIELVEDQSEVLVEGIREDSHDLEEFITLYPLKKTAAMKGYTLNRLRGRFIGSRNLEGDDPLLWNLDLTDKGVCEVLVDVMSKRSDKGNQLNTGRTFLQFEKIREAVLSKPEVLFALVDLSLHQCIVAWALSVAPKAISNLDILIPSIKKFCELDMIRYPTIRNPLQQRKNDIIAELAESDDEVERLFPLILELESLRSEPIVHDIIAEQIRVSPQAPQIVRKIAWCPEIMESISIQEAIQAVYDRLPKPVFIPPLSIQQTREFLIRSTYPPALRHILSDQEMSGDTKIKKTLIRHIVESSSRIFDQNGEILSRLIELPDILSRQDVQETLIQSAKDQHKSTSVVNAFSIASKKGHVHVIAFVPTIMNAILDECLSKGIHNISKHTLVALARDRLYYDFPECQKIIHEMALHYRITQLVEVLVRVDSSPLITTYAVRGALKQRIPEVAARLDSFIESPLRGIWFMVDMLDAINRIGPWKDSQLLQERAKLIGEIFGIMPSNV